MALPQEDARPLRQQVFEQVRANGQMPRMDVARALNISPGSVTTITSDLIARGLLQEVEDSQRGPSRGRPPIALRVAPLSRFVVGMKLSDERHTAVLLDLAGNIVAGAHQTSGALRQSNEEILADVNTLMGKLLQKAGRAPDDISAVGIGLPGLVDACTGVVRWSPVMTETDTPLRDQLAAMLGLPVSLDNDTNLLTLAELWFGAGRGISNFAVVTIERGVGMGLVLNNRLFRGALGPGMELGHTKVQLDGALCRCGQRGCLEAYVADYALIREAGTALDRDPRIDSSAVTMIETLYQEANAGNEAALAIFSRAGRFLSVGLANIVQLFDPERIILSGERMRYAYMTADDMLAEMNSMILPAGRTPTPVDIHAWSGSVWAKGAAALALSELTDTLLGDGAT
ncbi:MAG: ROK family protein [Sulfitobacter sp.]|jgi:predicted NBD/HSP70 family sugar kinase|uniref:ROK family protein n=1 Tax=Sulfitobacter sp. TaxID=1903071 RepID=UPI000C6A0E48|nr:XylR family transcriptional regulator [Roseobacter sp.]MBV49270.1 XylR family transcriptional regulator [Roseobacter sp.]THF93650.1 MAG: ROK family protein [Sulfitobacter sp. SK025]|tara:strand:+ start:3815 stop:5017 length:1203 start_codon:yes stop_codon:yes gene_type:complete